MKPIAALFAILFLPLAALAQITLPSSLPPGVRPANTWGCSDGYNHLPCELPAYEIHLSGQTASIGAASQSLPSSSTGFAASGATYRVTATAYCTAPGTSTGTMQLGLGGLGSNIFQSGLATTPFFGSTGNCQDAWAWQSITFTVQANSPQANYGYNSTLGGSPTGSPAYTFNTVVELISLGH